MEKKTYRYEYGKLRGRIVEKFETMGNFAQCLSPGMVRETLSVKINNKSAFDQYEITAFCDMLEIPYEEIPSYFFTLAVGKSPQEGDEPVRETEKADH